MHVQSGIKKAAYSATLVSSYHAKAGSDFDSCEIAGRWAWGGGRVGWVFMNLHSKSKSTN